MTFYTEGLQEFYDSGASRLFQEIEQRVNRQAIAPLFRPRVRRWGRILDIGCGNGHLAGELGVRRACFLDLSWERVKVCRQRIGAGSFAQADLFRLPFREGTFDGVICSNVLHYTGLEGFHELLRVTKKGGQMLLAFLEESGFTRALIDMNIALGLFPPVMREARLLNLSHVRQCDVGCKDSATISFFPPLFRVSRGWPLQGLVAMELERY